MAIEVRFAIIFQEDGLDLEGMKEELSQHGTITEIQDDMIIGDEGNIPVKIVYITGTLSDYWSVKFKYNCVENPMQRYVLWPMAGYEERKKAKELFGAV